MKNMTRAERWGTEKQAKTAWLRFYVSFTFDHTIQVGLDVVQMVLYFKTSWSFKVIAPLNGNFI